MTVHNGTLDTRGVLADVDELAAVLAGPGPRPRLLDVRWRLGGPPGRPEYRAGHLPGAVYVDLDDELAAPPAAGAGRHPLPDLAALQAAARSWGLRGGDAVVVYDDSGGLAAARAWWLLRWAGLADVRILDGGLPAWRAAGHPVELGDETVEPGDVTLSAGPPVLDPDGVAELLDEGGLLLDARSSERYRGDVASIDPRPGHIPGAVSAPTTENLTDDGHFRAPAALAERFAALGVGPGRPVGVYCGSGVTAAHEIAALTLAGVTDVRLYPGSFSQWAARPDRPVVTGPHPRPAPEPPVDVTGDPELISPVEASRRVAGGAILIDVRSAPRRAADGTIPTALVIDRNQLDAAFGPDAADPVAASTQTPVVVVCGTVDGSRPVAEALRERGFLNVAHVDGGFAQWRRDGLPVDVPAGERP
jgi:thiosulfate/3-mercaptopyruvate sulfurtransferase